MHHKSILRTIWENKFAQIDIKLCAKIKHSVKALSLKFWDKLAFVQLFFICPCFTSISIILVEFTCLIRIENIWLHFLYFYFSFIWDKVKTPHKTMRKDIMSTRKKYIYCDIWPLTQNIFLKGKHWQLVGWLIKYFYHFGKVHLLNTFVHNALIMFPQIQHSCIIALE